MRFVKGLFRLSFRHVESYDHLGKKVVDNYQLEIGWAYIGLFVAGLLKGCGAY